MPEDRGEPEGRAHARRFHSEVADKAARKQAARLRNRRKVWFWLGMMGLVGWSVAIPAVLGVFLGVWLDETFGGRVSWTLTLLLVGVVVGCLNAWFWVERERNE